VRVPAASSRPDPIELGASSDAAPAPTAASVGTAGPARPAAGLGIFLAFLASAAVLTLELLSLRLVAPYVGLTIQANSAVIGMALGGIAAGAWLGGQLADTHDPKRLLGPLFLLAGALTVVMLPLVRLLGQSIGSSNPAVVLLMAMVAVFLPSAALSAVPPLVVKQMLADLRLTGSTVGLVSAAGTVGGLVATFLTGFLLVAYFPVRGLVLTIAGLLLVTGALLTLRTRGARTAGRRSVAAPVLLVGALALGGLSLAGTPRCEVETAYHCARLVNAAPPAGALTLHLDTLSHSYVNQADPTDLRFAYTRALAAVAGAVAPPGAAITALHIGGGGATMPRYLAATRPGTDSTVLEVDRGVVNLDKHRLGLRTDDRLRVRVVDGRVGLHQTPTDSKDLVIGDAFGGVSVPWHLTTQETAREVRRVLHPGGIYAVNVIDYPPNDFAHAEFATLATTFTHVAVMSAPTSLANQSGGNFVLVASDAPLPVDAMRAGLVGHPQGWQLLTDDAAVAWAHGHGKPLVLTDDYAPVDQILTPQPVASAEPPSGTTRG
jgi:MFS family permease